MDNWDDLKLLLEVCRSGSMAAAARRLDTTPATVSRHMARLTEVLGFDPLIRTPDGWRLNDRIGDFFDHVEAFDNQITAFRNTALSDGARDFTLTIGCPPFVTNFILNRNLREFLNDNSGSCVVFNDCIFHDSLGQNDILLTMARPQHGRIVTKYLGTMQFGFFLPADAQPDGKWIGLTERYDSQPMMQFAREFFGTEPTIRMESLMTVLFAIRTTRLPGLLTNTVAADDPSLIRIGGESEDLSAQIFACYHDTRRKDPVIELALAWIADAFESVDPH